MAHIESNVRIKAPLEDVFRFVSDWHNAEGFRDGVYDYECVGDQPCGDGARFCCKVRSPVIGETAYTLEMVDFSPNRGWVLQSVEGPDYIERWWFHGEPGWPRYTRITYDLRYKVPVPVVGGVVDELLVRPRWEERADNTLKNIRIMVEAKQTG